MSEPEETRFFSGRTKKKSLFLSGALLLCLLGFIYQAIASARAQDSFAATTSAARAYSISGTVFNDSNDNGVRDAKEPGANGVVAQAYNDADVVVASDTTKTVAGQPGRYTLNIPAGTGPVRMQFGGFGYSTAGELHGFQPSRHSAMAGTTVAFVSGLQASNTVNLGIEKPGNGCQAQPGKGQAQQANVPCLASTNEIGNRVWFDANANGIQDPNEAGLNGVTVHLYAADGKTLLKTARTDAAGEYYFTVAPNVGYVIRLDNQADYSSGPLKGYQLTSANRDSCTHVSDSKGVLPQVGKALGAGNYPQIVVASRAPGYNSHMFDIGFTVYANQARNQVSEDAGSFLGTEWAVCHTPSPTATPGSPNQVTPTPGSHKTPTPSVHKSPTPEAHKTPTPSVHKSPTPEAHKTPTPGVHKTPTPGAHKTPTPGAHETPTATPTSVTHQPTPVAPTVPGLPPTGSDPENGLLP